MSRTARFRQQHEELLKIINELQASLNVDALSKDGSAARTCLGKLLGMLMVHIAAEDKVLYPELVASKDPAVAALAKRISTEMKSTGEELTAYGKRWPGAGAIKENPAGFIKDTKHMLDILTNRIRRENQELYAAADKVEG